MILKLVKLWFLFLSWSVVETGFILLEGHLLIDPLFVRQVLEVLLVLSGSFKNAGKTDLLWQLLFSLTLFGGFCLLTVDKCS
jgi:hypothetical protein